MSGDAFLGLRTILSDAVPPGEAYLVNPSVLTGDALRDALNTIWEQPSRPDQTYLSPRQGHAYRLSCRHLHLAELLVRQPRKRRHEPSWLWRWRYGRWLEEREASLRSVLRDHPYVSTPFTFRPFPGAALNLLDFLKLTGLSTL